ncbi:hypothetical protein [Exiguobacterium aurantiacum]|uniref:hypothetical protein n=1 Tax=Exiguobacterium aurantiacum TaxID=33987 RepID=UPI0004940F9D|nr:hypothetical protein [Exiguobacterium aurantiacum]
MLEFVSSHFVADLSAQTKLPLAVGLTEATDTTITSRDGLTHVVIPLDTVYDKTDYGITFVVEPTHYQNTVTMLRSAYWRCSFSVSDCFCRYYGRSTTSSFVD